jgi:hypothetical protein
MSTEDAQFRTSDEKTPAVSPGNYSPVTVYNHDTVGAMFLGIFAVTLLIGWMRAEARYRALLTPSGLADGKDLPDTR